MGFPRADRKSVPLKGLPGLRITPADRHQMSRLLPATVAAEGYGHHVAAGLERPRHIVGIVGTQSLIYQEVESTARCVHALEYVVYESLITNEPCR
jgi:hypothetical protein